MNRREFLSGAAAVGAGAEGVGGAAGAGAGAGIDAEVGNDPTSVRSSTVTS